MCICIHIYLYIYKYLYVYTPTYVHTHEHIYTHFFQCVCTSLCEMYVQCWNTCIDWVCDTSRHFMCAICWNTRIIKVWWDVYSVYEVSVSEYKVSVNECQVSEYQVSTSNKFASRLNGSMQTGAGVTAALPIVCLVSGSWQSAGAHSYSDTPRCLLRS